MRHWQRMRLWKAATPRWKRSLPATARNGSAPRSSTGTSGRCRPTQRADRGADEAGAGLSGRFRRGRPRLPGSRASNRTAMNPSSRGWYAGLPCAEGPGDSVASDSRWSVVPRSGSQCQQVWRWGAPRLPLRAQSRPIPESRMPLPCAKTSWRRARISGQLSQPSKPRLDGASGTGCSIPGRFD